MSRYRPSCSRFFDALRHSFYAGCLFCRVYMTFCRCVTWDVVAWFQDVICEPCSMLLCSLVIRVLANEKRQTEKIDIVIIRRGSFDYWSRGTFRTNMYEDQAGKRKHEVGAWGSGGLGSPSAPPPSAAGEGGGGGQSDKYYVVLSKTPCLWGWESCDTDRRGESFGQQSFSGNRVVRGLIILRFLVPNHWV